MQRGDRPKDAADLTFQYDTPVADKINQVERTKCTALGSSS